MFKYFLGANFKPASSPIITSKRILIKLADSVKSLRHIFISQNNHYNKLCEPIFYRFLLYECKKRANPHHKHKLFPFLFFSLTHKHSLTPCCHRIFTMRLSYDISFHFCLSMRHVLIVPTCVGCFRHES